MDIIAVQNDGRKILSTNYWDSDFAHAGKYYLTINAGAYRLLLPKSLSDMVKEIKTGNEVVISRGPWPDMGKSDALELMFDDNSQNPFCLHLTPESIDRLPLDADSGWKGVFHVYFDGGADPLIEFQRVFYRRVKKLPWMKPAPENNNA